MTTLPNQFGDSIALADLKGQIVLVDFWASWCKPCRDSHPLLNELFEVYSKLEFTDAESFTVYSISLDDKKSNWLKAVEKDDLKLDYLVADLVGMEKSKLTEQYDFSQLPCSYLIDQDGRIVGKNQNLNRLEVELRRRVAKGVSLPPLVTAL